MESAPPLTVGGLFSGLGGFELAFQRAGCRIRWMVESDPYCRCVLRRHWPDVELFGDVRYCGRHNLAPVDILCGGFPCQPHALIGERRGSADDRDLWPEFRRLICALRPRWVVAENVSGILSTDAGRFFAGILRDLATSGYDAEWECLPASAFGAPHERDRLWLVAYPLDDADRAGLEGYTGDGDDGRRPLASRSTAPASVRGRAPTPRLDWRPEPSTHWQREPDVARLVDGISNRVERVRAIGNSLVPQIAEWVAHQIRAHDERRPRTR